MAHIKPFLISAAVVLVVLVLLRVASDRGTDVVGRIAGMAPTTPPA